MSLHEKVVKELGYSMSIPNESDIAFAALWVSRRADGSLNSTMFHLEEEELTNDLRERIAQVLRNLADTVCPTPHALDEATCTAKYHLALAEKGDTRCGVCGQPLRQ